ncbi:MAG: hypothetical protein C7B43_16210 [Sulfobacillus benefaciens]|uniref:Type II toxin-antitoxin system RelE/ParE family toxin n=1 Tax=Sulfobacillus benefaciens TaxID=453960 RepID=A0A2T2WU16_9FIRM|nr:MAG: hypothetical protein C7B43_16210 [Sulfobacillus benefaciens]
MRRAATQFFVLEAFKKATRKLKPPGQEKVLMSVRQFQEEWKQSEYDADLSPGYDLQPLEHRAGQYRVVEIRAGRDWRVALMIWNDVSQAYWLHTWRKSGRRNPQDYDTARERAKRLWQRKG